MVVIDATFLLLLFRPDTPVPAGQNGLPVERPKDRVDHLVAQLSKARTTIIVPTPALSEALVRASPEVTQEIVNRLQRYSVFQIVPFNSRAAIEVATMSRVGTGRGRKRETSDATWAKLKYDRQIVAIAKVAGAEAIYSDDRDIKAIAQRTKIKIIRLEDLELPPEKPPDLFSYLAPNAPSPEDEENSANDEDKEADAPPGRP